MLFRSVRQLHFQEELPDDRDCQGMPRQFSLELRPTDSPTTGPSESIALAKLSSLAIIVNTQNVAAELNQGQLTVKNNICLLLKAAIHIRKNYSIEANGRANKQSNKIKLQKITNGYCIYSKKEHITGINNLIPCIK